MGNVYISDYTGRKFSESLSNVLRGTEYVDFERANSLEGVFLANKYDFIKGSSKRGVTGTRKMTKAGGDIG